MAQKKVKAVKESALRRRIAAAGPGVRRALSHVIRAEQIKYAYYESHDPAAFVEALKKRGYEIRPARSARREKKK